MSIDTTIVISNFNNGKYLHDTITSCVKQSKPCQIVFVDDCSTDNSWNFICSFKKNGLPIPMMAVRQKQNSGGNARGRNLGISLSSTPYITFLDSDDILPPYSIEDREAEISDHTLVHTRMLRARGKELTYKRSLKLILNRAYVRGNLVMDKRQTTLIDSNKPIHWWKGIAGGSVLLRSDVFNDVGLFDEEMKWKIDREMWYRILIRDYKPYFLDRICYVYRIHGTQITRNNSRKNPKRIKKIFDRKIKERNAGITAENTLLLSNYNPDDYIKDKFVIGDFKGR